MNINMENNLEKARTESMMLNTFTTLTHHNSEIQPHLYLFSIMFESYPLKGIYTKEGVVGAQSEHEARVFVYEQYEKLFKIYPVGMSDIKLTEVFPDYGVRAEVTISKGE